MTASPSSRPCARSSVSGTRGGNLEAFKLSYEAATLEQPRARLTVRERADDEPHELPLNQWSFVDARSIKLRDGTKPKPGYLYEFHYEAKNPKVPLGFAATRDVVSWLRYDPAAIKATGGRISHALAIGFSQAGRYLRNHISEGFNRDEAGPQGLRRHPFSTSPASAASSSTRRSASRRAPAPSTRTTASRRTSFRSRRRRSPIR